MSPTPATPAPVSAALRVATGTAGAATVLAVLLSAVAPVLAAAALLLVQVAVTVPHVRSRLPRVAVLATPWVVIGLGAAVAVGVGLGTPAGLAVLACSTVVGHHVLVQTRRDVAVSLVTTTGTGLLVLSQAASWSVLPAVAVAWAAGVVALALRHAETRSDPARGAPAWRSVLRRAAWPVAWSLVTVLVVGLLGLQPPSAAHRLAGAAGGAGLDAPRTTRTTTAYLAGRLDLRVRGELPRTPVMEVPSGSDRLWRAGVLGTYDGVGWSPAAVGGRQRSAADPLGLGDGDPVAVPTPARALRTDDVTVLGDLGGLVLAPGHAVAVRAPGAQVEVYGQVLVVGSASYEVDSRAVPAARDVPGAGAGPLADDPDPATWTALPPTVTSRTRALAVEVTRGARTRAEVVARVEDHLRGGYAYDLGSPVPPPGQDAVDHFLFDARSGFCEQFAAAAVVLLRSLGVPARVATGFSGGEDRGERRLVRADTAHAWVEVWQPGVGWATSDPTPAGTEPTGLAAEVRALLAERDVRRWLAAAVVLLFVGAAVAVRRRRRGPVAVGAPPQQRAAAPLIEAAERLLVALDRAGRPSPPGETVAAVAGRVPEVAAALAVVERAAYAARPPGPRESLEAASALDAAAARLLAAQRAPS